MCVNVCEDLKRSSVLLMKSKVTTMRPSLIAPENQLWENIIWVSPRVHILTCRYRMGTVTRREREEEDCFGVLRDTN